LQAKFWFRRVWDQKDETWYVPEKVSDVKDTKDFQWKRDEDRSVSHGLGFCPLIWIRNLPTTKRHGAIDGGCTFDVAIDTVIEADYLLSQSGRALKYAADPTLVIKQGTLGEGDGPVRVGGAARALSVDVDGDAKLGRN